MLANDTEVSNVTCQQDMRYLLADEGKLKFHIPYLLDRSRYSRAENTFGISNKFPMTGRGRGPGGKWGCLQCWTYCAM